MLRRSADGRWRQSDQLADEEWQARALEDLLREAFAHHQVTAFTWWDLADGHSWLPGGGLLREDLSPKPVYRLIDRLVHEEWHTRERVKIDSEGRVRFRGFFGDYSVRALSASPGAQPAYASRAQESERPLFVSGPPGASCPPMATSPSTHTDR